MCAHSYMHTHHTGVREGNAVDMSACCRQEAARKPPCGETLKCHYIPLLQTPPAWLPLSILHEYTVTLNKIERISKKK